MSSKTSWSPSNASAPDPERRAVVATSGDDGGGQANCDLCGGTGWASYPDPFFGGAYVDARCPACCDTTVRARKTRWESNDGHKVGPR